MFAARTFFGSVGTPIQPLSGGLASDQQTAPVAAAAQISVRRSGLIDGSGNVESFSSAWFDPAVGNPGDAFWVRFVLLSGTAPGGSALNTWHPLTSDRAVSLLVNTISAQACSLTVEIAYDAAGAAIATSGTFSLAAEQINP